MTGEGTVIEIHGSIATVKIQKSSSCSHDCSECGACKNPTYNTEAVNSKGAKAGDRVLIESPTGRVLFVAFILYMLPVLLLLICYTAAHHFFGSSALTVCIVAAVIAIWLAVIKLVNKRLKVTNTIIQIINE